MARNENELRRKAKDLINAYNTKSKMKAYKNKPWLVYRYLRNRFYLSDPMINYILAEKGWYQKTV